MAVIKVKAWGKDQGDFVFIEGENFDPDFHEHFIPGKPAKVTKKRVKREK